MPEELSRNCFDVILQHDWSIEQCLLHIRVFFGGKTKSPCFVLSIHWLIKQITNTYGNHFSRSYENRSNRSRMQSHKRDGIRVGRIREFSFSSDSAYSKQKREDKPITMNVTALCDWFTSSASACDSAT